MVSSSKVSFGGLFESKVMPPTSDLNTCATIHIVDFFVVIFPSPLYECFGNKNFFGITCRHNALPLFFSNKIPNDKDTKFVVY